MKKALTILLAVAMMFCFSATAFAADFNDTGKCSDVAKDAINKVAALGIVEGYEDGGFHPTATITRAEFAKMADIAAGLEDSAKQLEGVASQFSDVKSGAWYTGWINLASAQGYVKGYENGTYGPNNTITYAEVVTVLLRLLGYNDNLTGPWPINYINQANKLGILDDVENFSANAPATRSDVAIMLSAVLDENVVVWDKDVDKFVDDTKKVNGEDETYTLLDDAFDGSADQYAVVEVTLGDAIDGEYTVKAYKWDDAIKADALADLDNLEELKAYTFDAELDTPVANGEFYNLIGKQVTIINDDNDAKYIQVDSKVVEVEKAEAQGSTRVKLDGKSYKVADSAYINFFTDSQTNITGYAALNDDDEVYGVFTDNDVNVELINPVAEFVTDVDDAEDDEIEINGVANDDFSDEDVVILKDGKRVYATDLAAGDVLARYTKVDDVYVVDTAKEGKVTAISGDKVTIDGQKYIKAGAALFNSDYEEDGSINWSDYKGYNVQFVLDKDNTMKAALFKEAGSSSEYYGVITDVTYQTTKGNANPSKPYKEVVIFTEKGETTTFAVDTDANGVENFTNDKGYMEGSVVQYKLNKDGEIKEVKDLQGAYVDNYKDLGTEVTVDDNKYIKYDNKSYTVNSDAIIFNIKEDCEVELLTKADLLAGDTIEANAVDGVDKYENDAYANGYMACGLDSSKVEIFVVTDCNASGDWQYAIVDEVVGETEDMDNAVTFTNLDGEYEMDGANTYDTEVVDDALVAVKFSGTDVKDIIVIDPTSDNSLVAVGQVVLGNDYNKAVTVQKATAINDGQVDYANGYFKVTADTKYVYVNSDGDYEMKDMLKKDRYFSAVINDDGEAELVVVFNSNSTPK